MSGRCQKTAKSNNRQIIIEHMFVYKKPIFHRPYYTTEMQYLSTYFCVIYKSFLVWQLPQTILTDQLNTRQDNIPLIYTATFWTQLCLKKRLGRSCVYRYAPITCEQFAETWRYSFPIKACVAIKVANNKTTLKFVYGSSGNICVSRNDGNIWMLCLANDYKNTHKRKSFSWK